MKIHKVHAMKINSLVSQVWGDTLRLGVVTNKVIKKNGWAYLDVKWFQDDAYETARSTTAEEKHDFNDKTVEGLYRVDHVKIFDSLKALKFYFENDTDAINLD